MEARPILRRRRPDRHPVRPARAARVLLALTALGAPTACLASGVDRSAERSERPADRQARWPAGWEGLWAGTLEFDGASALEPIRFELFVGSPLPDGSRPWELRYGDTPAREYRLVPVDVDEGRWAIDERNGIVLPACRLGDTLVSAFAVGENLLLTRQRFHAEGIDHEIVVLDRSEATTGQDVATHAVRSRQRAALERVRAR